MQYFRRGCAYLPYLRHRLVHHRYFTIDYIPVGRANNNHLLFFFWFWERQNAPWCFYHSQNLLFVAEVKDISFFCSFIRATAFGIGHQICNDRQLLDKGGIVTGRYHAFIININDIISHHFQAPYLSQRSKRVANELNKIRWTSHIFILKEIDHRSPVC